MKKRRETTYYEGFLPASRLLLLLEKRYPRKEYAMFTQVPTGTGWSSSRLADAAVLSLWPSRGLSLTGFEVKVYRSDWKREKAAPQKAEAIARYCDFWFLVACNEDIIPQDQIPEPWGLMLPNKKGDGLVTVKGATKLEAEAWTRPFMAGLLRRASDSMVPTATIEEKLREAHAAGKAEAEHVDPNNAELERLRKLQLRVREFEQAAKMSLEHGYNNVRQIGEACALVMEMQRELKWCGGAATQALSGLREQIARLRGDQLLHRIDNTVATIERLSKQLQEMELLPADNARESMERDILSGLQADVE